MIIYLAGKITGNPEYRKQFAAAKAELKAEGHIVLNPAELPEGMSPAAYMRICFAMIDTADELRALPGWYCKPRRKGGNGLRRLYRKNGACH
jgi:hypothetical protein